MSVVRYDGIGGHWNEDGSPTPESTNRETIEPLAGIAPRPKIVCLCGSSRFCGEMAIIAWVLERDEGYITLGLHLLPDWYVGLDAAPDHIAEAAGRKEHMDELHKRKIDLADEVLICNIEGYIGESTRSEIEYARAHGKPVRFVEPEV